ncbi:MAG: S8 family serine peptidase [Planctomycetota bacterium]
MRSKLAILQPSVKQSVSSQRPSKTTGLLNPLDLVKLPALMELTSGRSGIMVGLIDGPIAMDHPSLATGNIREVPGKMRGTCAQADSAACMHGTSVAGILSAKRSSAAPAICPDCTILVRPIFAETTSGNTQMLSTTPEELAAAIIDSIDAGARVINLSVSIVQPSAQSEHALEDALDLAARRGVLIVAAAGNEGAIGSSVVTRYPGVIPVVAYDLQGRPMGMSNLGSSIGRRGLGAPGENITSLGTDRKATSFGGTSAAAPFVTGTIALLWSIFPAAVANEVRSAVTQAGTRRRNTVVPPLLDAWAAYQAMRKAYS